MNQKELREIRKRFTLDKDSISHVYGCYVNAAKDIVARMDMSMGLMEQEEAELYLKLLKKSISGTLGKNLLDIEFSTKQVEDSDEHRLLQALRQSHLRDEDMRELFYKRVIESLDFGDDSYVILLASDSYDIPFKGRDDELWEEGSNEVFDYIICCICPVKDARASLRYFAEEQNFRGASSGHVLGNPELGIGKLSSIFCSARIGVPAAIRPTTGTSATGVWLAISMPDSMLADGVETSGAICSSASGVESSTIIRARGLEGSFLIKPCFTRLAISLCAVDVDLMFSAEQISRTVGG